MKKTLPLLVAATGLISFVLLRKEEVTEPEADVAPVVPVRTATISRATLGRYVVAYGYVEPAPPGAGAPGGGSHLSAPVFGVVTKVLCEEGHQVTKGTLLFQLDSRVADRAVEKARAALRFAEMTDARQRRLVPTGGASQRALEDADRVVAAARGDLDAALAQQALLQIRAPFSGRVAQVLARPGQAVSPNSVLGTLTDAEHEVVSVFVPAEEAHALAPGAPTEVLVEPKVSTTLSFVSPEVDRMTGQVLVRAVLPPQSHLRPGRMVRVRVLLTQAEDALVVPEQAIVHPTPETCAISIVEAGLAQRVPVVCGITEGGRTAVRGEKLREGLAVVTEGAFGIPERSRVEVLNR